MKAASALLLKLSGDLFSKGFPGGQAGMHAIVDQVAQLSAHFHIGVVIGGGNFFRGSHDKHTYGISQGAADGAGMLATMMNGIILQDLLVQRGVKTTLLNAFHASGIADTVSQENIQKARASGAVIIFSGGSGAPYLTTDTAAVIRGLQMGATCVWKITKVDGLYDSDPKKNPTAQRIAKISHQDALAANIGLFDRAAIALAQDHNLPIRFFSMYDEQSLIRAHENLSHGSFITSSH